VSPDHVMWIVLATRAGHSFCGRINVLKDQAIEQYLHAVPKAELHVHLEGAVKPETILLLAQRNHVTLPVSTKEEAQSWFTYNGFPHFERIFGIIFECLKTADDYELISYEFGAEMARQQIRYAEVTVSVSSHRYAIGIPHDVYFAGLQRGRERVYQDFGVEIRWVFDIVRDISGSVTELARRAEYTTAVAIECMNDGVVALGLGGNEMNNPPERFTGWFERALAAGLHSAPHAGELAGPASVWGALEQLGAERIGHGTRSFEDPALVSHLAQRQIALELCPYSNVCLGVYPTITEHPLPHLHAAGVPVTVNSDDPPLFNTTMTHNVLALHDVFGFDLDTIDAILLNGVRHSFLPSEQKSQMEKLFIAEMRQLRNDTFYRD